MKVFPGKLYHGTDYKALLYSKEERTRITELCIEISELSYNIFLSDGFDIHNSLFSKSKYIDKMGEDLWSEFIHSYNHYNLRKNNSSWYRYDSFYLTASFQTAENFAKKSSILGEQGDIAFWLFKAFSAIWNPSDLFDKDTQMKFNMFKELTDRKALPVVLMFDRIYEEELLDEFEQDIGDWSLLEEHCHNPEFDYNFKLKQPNSLSINDAEIMYVEDFLTKEECSKLIHELETIYGPLPSQKILLSGNDRLSAINVKPTPVSHDNTNKQILLNELVSIYKSQGNSYNDLLNSCYLRFKSTVDSHASLSISDYSAFLVMHREGKICNPAFQSSALKCLIYLKDNNIDICDRMLPSIIAQSEFFCVSDIASYHLETLFATEIIAPYHELQKKYLYTVISQHIDFVELLGLEQHFILSSPLRIVNIMILQHDDSESTIYTIEDASGTFYNYELLVKRIIKGITILLITTHKNSNNTGIKSVYALKSFKNDDNGYPEIESIEHGDDHWYAADSLLERFCTRRKEYKIKYL